jgi:hypothetical protein
MFNLQPPRHISVAHTPHYDGVKKREPAPAAIGIFGLAARRSMALELLELPGLGTSAHGHDPYR